MGDSDVCLATVVAQVAVPTLQVRPMLRRDNEDPHLWGRWNRRDRHAYSRLGRCPFGTMIIHDAVWFVAGSSPARPRSGGWMKGGDLWMPALVLGGSESLYGLRRLES